MSDKVDSAMDGQICTMHEERYKEAIKQIQKVEKEKEKKEETDAMAMQQRRQN
jgi:hypothetical protein